MSSADDEDELVGRVFLYTPSRTSHGPWPCIVLHSFSGGEGREGSKATTPGLEMTTEVRRAFEASKLEDKCLVLYFPIPDPVRGQREAEGWQGTAFPSLLPTATHTPSFALPPPRAELWQADGVGSGVCAAAHCVRL